MNPMTGIWNSYEFRILECVESAVVHRISEPTLLAVNQQRRTSDSAPHCLHLVHVIALGIEEPDVVVELPAKRSILVSRYTMNREMVCLFGRQERVGRKHSARGRVDRRVVLRSLR